MSLAKADLERTAAPAGGFPYLAQRVHWLCVSRSGRRCRIRGGTAVILLEGPPINEAEELQCNTRCSSTKHPPIFARREQAGDDATHFGAWRAYYKAVVEAGIYAGVKPLDAPETGTTVRRRDGKPLVQDGPYASSNR